MSYYIWLTCAIYVFFWGSGKNSSNLLTAMSLENDVEWPVFFERLGKVHSVHNKWDLRLKVRIHLSGLESRLIKIIHRLGLLRLDKNGPSKNTTEGRSQAPPSRLEDLKFKWEDTNEHLLIRAISLQRRARNLHQLSQNLKAKRVKRQDENDEDGETLDNGILKTMFGIAYNVDVESIKSRLKKINNRLSNQVDTVKVSQINLSSKTSDVLNKQHSEIQMVEQMTQNLEQKVENMETNPFLKSAIGDIVHRRNIAYQNIHQDIDLISERLSEIEDIIVCLSAGKLSKSIVTPRSLRNHLRTISKQLPLNYSMLFEADEPLWPYYSVLAASALFDEQLENIIIHFSIPLVDHNSIFDLHRVHNLPLKIREGYSVTTDISTEYLVTDHNKNYFLELKKNDFTDCQIFNHKGEQFYCGLPPMLRSSNARSCVMQLFQGLTDPTWCQTKIKYQLIQPFTRLYNGSWIYSAIKRQIPVTLSCPNNTLNTALIGFGVIRLAEGCTISSKDFFYPSTFMGVMEVSINFGGKKMLFENSGLKNSEAEQNDQDVETINNEILALGNTSEHHSLGLSDIISHDYNDEIIDSRKRKEAVSSLEDEDEHNEYDRIETFSNVAARRKLDGRFLNEFIIH